MPRATTIQCPPTCTPSISSPTRSSASSGVARHASSCAWVCATKRRLTALLLVPRMVTSAPSGSRLRAYLAGRHTDQYLVDHAPVQRVRIRECPGRWQRNLLAGAPRSPVVSESNTNTSVRSSKSGQSLYDTVPSSPAAFVIVIGTTSVDTETVAHASFSRRAP